MQTFRNSGSRKEFTNPTLKTARFSNSLDSKRFRAVSEQRTRNARVKDRATVARKKKRKTRKALLFYRSRSIFRAAKTEIRVPRSFFALK